MTVAGDSGSDTIDIGTDTLTIAGGTGITSAVTADTATLTLDNTAVTPGSYGGTTTVPVITIDQQGRITAASTSTIGSVLNITGDSGSDSINLGTDTLEFEGGTGVTTTVSAASDKVTFAIGQAIGTTDDVTFNNVTVDGTLSTDDITANSNSIAGNDCYW